MMMILMVANENSGKYIQATDVIANLVNLTRATL